MGDDAGTESVQRRGLILYRQHEGLAARIAPVRSRIMQQGLDVATPIGAGGSSWLGELGNALDLMTVTYRIKYGHQFSSPALVEDSATVEASPEREAVAEILALTSDNDRGAPRTWMLEMQPWVDLDGALRRTFGWRRIVPLLGVAASAGRFSWVIGRCLVA